MSTVLLGMSGGVDSSVAALLLLEQGYEVIGATMSFWDHRVPDAEWNSGGCFGPQEREHIASAERVCRLLSLRHEVIPLQQEYSQTVLSYFKESYLSGKTPNPCVFCNSGIKFGAFVDKARAMGLEFELFATGHYVRKRFSEGRWQLLRAEHSSKDQSYFLYRLGQEQIAGTLFPLGEMSKAEIRELADGHGLGFLNQNEESQDFISESVYPHVFGTGKAVPGDMIDHEGRKLGRHRGLIYYTVGQRKNLGVSGMPEPNYVIRIEAETNTIVLGPKALLYKDRLRAENLNWVSIPVPASRIRAEARIRFGHEAAPCLIAAWDQDKVELCFDQPQLAITPGQSVVFYQGELLLGGGIIV
jgi:tRNA-specific 2-thiouridylase